MVDINNDIVKVFSAVKMVASFFIVAGIHCTTYFLFGRADGGVIAIVLSPFVSLYVTAKISVFIILTGFCLYNRAFNSFWFTNRHLYIITLIVGLAGLFVGIINAEHAYNELKYQSSAQNFSVYLTNPSLFLLLFSLSFRPAKVEEEKSVSS